MPHRLVALALVALILAGACSTKTSDRNIVLIDPPDAEQVMRGEKALLGLGRSSRAAWVDPRTQAKYRAGHIAGAVSLPYAEVAARHRELADYDILIVYGEDYGDDLASAMSKTLMGLGHKDVRTLRGGITAWKGAGHDVEQE